MRNRRGLGSGACRLDEVAGQRAHRPDYQIILYVGLLMLFGLIIMYAIGPQRANVLNKAFGTNNYTDTYFVIKQLVSLAVAIGAFFVVSRLPFKWLTQYADKILIAGLALCGLLFVFGNLLDVKAVTQCSLGACRWISLGPLGGFQVAELLKFGVLLYLSTFIGIRMRQGLINDMQKTVIPVLAVSALALFIVVVVQRDLGTGTSLGAIIASMLMVSGLSPKIGMKLIVAVAVLGMIVVVATPYRRERLMTFLTGHEDSAVADTSGYHIRNAMIALGTGGMFGLGIGNSIQATGYLPEAINDSVFAIIGETFGFIGASVVLGLFAALLLRLLKITDHLPDPTMRLAVAGVFGWLAAHVILNIASMVKIFPLTGITLPLVSFGGTSMIFITGAMGLAFQLSKYTAHGNLTMEEPHANLSSRRGIGRSRFAGRRSI